MTEGAKCALVVEDDDNIRRLIELVLRSRCQTIDGAADGEEAIAMLRRRTYDIVVLDIMLPKVNGLEVAEMIRTLPTPPRVLVVLSAVARYFSDRFPRNAVILQKPFELDRLEEVVAQGLEAG
jgi:CheY-like chemotaxis protein